MSEVRGSGQECQAATAQEWPRGPTPQPRSGAAARRSYPTSEVRVGSREDLPCVRGQRQRPGGQTPCPRSGGCVVAGGPKELFHVQGQGRRPGGATPHQRSGAEAQRTPCLRGDGQEELPHVRGQGQGPRVPGCDGAGKAERRYPTSQVRGVGWEDLPHARGQGRRPGDPKPCPRPGAVARRSNPTSKEQWLSGHRRA